MPRELQLAIILANPKEYRYCFYSDPTGILTGHISNRNNEKKNIFLIDLSRNPDASHRPLVVLLLLLFLWKWAKGKAIFLCKRHNMESQPKRTIRVT